MGEVDWAAEYAEARARIRVFLDDMGEEAAAAPVPPCPGWTVQEALSHLVGIAVAMAEGDRPDGDAQAWLDGLVAARAGRSIGSLIDEWERVAPAIDAVVDRMGAAGSRIVSDVVAHEHDIRLALGRPGARASSGVRSCAAAASTRLAGDLATHGLPAVRITSGGHTWCVGDGEPELEIELDPFELIRVLGSRRSEAQLRSLDWKGDLDRYLPAIAHYPLPERDIDE